MGSGLIPADLATWALRRRQLVPAFHKAWLESTVGIFNACSSRLCQSLDKTAGRVVNMEAMYNSVALDIIGKAVFNFDFQSVENTSPIIDAVYGLMQEAEHRSFFLLPYWKVPILGYEALGVGPLVERQQTFKAHISLINDSLDTLIKEALLTRSEEDIEALEARDYASLENASLLRFLVGVHSIHVYVNACIHTYIHTYIRISLFGDFLFFV